VGVVDTTTRELKGNGSPVKKSREGMPYDALILSGGLFRRIGAWGSSSGLVVGSASKASTSGGQGGGLGSTTSLGSLVGSLGTPRDTLESSGGQGGGSGSRTSSGSLVSGYRIFWCHYKDI